MSYHMLEIKKIKPEKKVTYIPKDLFDIIYNADGFGSKNGWLYFLVMGSRIFEKYAGAYEHNNESNKALQRALDRLHRLLVSSLEKARKQICGFVAYDRSDLDQKRLNPKDAKNAENFIRANGVIARHVLIFFDKIFIFSNYSDVRCQMIVDSWQQLCREANVNGYLGFQDEILNCALQINSFYLQAKDKNRLNDIHRLVVLKLEFLRLILTYVDMSKVEKAISSNLILSIIPMEDQCALGVPFPWNEELHGLVLRRYSEAYGYPPDRSYYEHAGALSRGAADQLLSQLSSQGMRFSTKQLTYYETQKWYYYEGGARRERQAIPEFLKGNIRRFNRQGLEQLRQLGEAVERAMLATPHLFLFFPPVLAQKIVEYLINSQDKITDDEVAEAKAEAKVESKTFALR